MMMMTYLRMPPPLSTASFTRMDAAHAPMNDSSLPLAAPSGGLFLSQMLWALSPPLPVSWVQGNAWVQENAPSPSPQAAMSLQEAERTVLCICDEDPGLTLWTLVLWYHSSPACPPYLPCTSVLLQVLHNPCMPPTDHPSLPVAP